MLRKAGNGELAFHTAVTSRDEIGDLAAAYNQAIDRIRAYDDLKTKKIASQKRSIERLIDYFNLPVCILTKNLTALYYNGPFASLFGPSVPSKAPENGLDIAKIPEMEDFFEQLRKRTAPVGGDFHFTFIAPDGSEVSLRGRPVRNAALVLENIIVVGEVNRNNKHEG